MSIGAALADARQRAGLTITQVSARTRIRETIIRDIERDDYASCGGDFWARGHIRSIARVTGADPVALIREYDAAREEPPDPVMDTVADRIAGPGGPHAGGPGGPGGPGGSGGAASADDSGPPTDPGFAFWAPAGRSPAEPELGYAPPVMDPLGDSDLGFSPGNANLGYLPTDPDPGYPSADDPGYGYAPAAGDPLGDSGLGYSPRNANLGYLPTDPDPEYPPPAGPGFRHPPDDPDGGYARSAPEVGFRRSPADQDAGYTPLPGQRDFRDSPGDPDGGYARPASGAPGDPGLGYLPDDSDPGYASPSAGASDDLGFRYPPDDSDPGYARSASGSPEDPGFGYLPDNPDPGSTRPRAGSLSDLGFGYLPDDDPDAGYAPPGTGAPGDPDPGYGPGGTRPPIVIGGVAGGGNGVPPGRGRPGAGRWSGAGAVGAGRGAAGGGTGETRRLVIPAPSDVPPGERAAGWPAAPAPRGDRHRLAVTAVIGTALLAAVVIVIYVLIAGSHPQRPAAAGRTDHQSAGASTPPARPTATPASSAPSAPPPAAQPLRPVTATAFGPGGSGHGDNPQNASLAIDGRPASIWHTDWYTTARFGNLQSGTGLLLDMGRPVTITSAQIMLVPGADVQLRVGSAPDLASLRPVASAANAGGALQMRPARPAAGRYVLIWFTQLPQDSAGTFEGGISGIRLTGRP